MKRFLAAGVFCLMAAAVAAHPHLEQAQPAADSTAAGVGELRLRFSEAVEPRLSTVRLETEEERTVTAPAAEPDAADPKVLVVRLYEKLAPGRYRVRWSVVAADGHKMTGAFTFLASR